MNNSPPVLEITVVVRKVFNLEPADICGGDQLDPATATDEELIGRAKDYVLNEIRDEPSVLSMTAEVEREDVPAEDIPDYADLMDVATFKSYVARSMFIDYDGHGHFADPNGTGKMGRAFVLPSNLDDPDWGPPEWATHVAWFNR